MELKPGEDVLQLSGVVTAVETPAGDGPQPAELAKYRVQLTAAGQIRRGFDWDLKVPEATLKRDYAKFNKAGSYVNQHGNHVPSYMQSMQDKVGFFRRAKWNDETKTIDADLVLARTPLAETFKAQLDLDLANSNSMVQFSAVYSYDFSETETKKNGNTHYVVTVDKIREVFSVDAVDRGAFPMKPLAALSEWRGNLSKEGDMAKEVETAQETDTGGVDVAALQNDLTQRGVKIDALEEGLQARDKDIAELREQHAAMEKRDKEREDAFKAQQEGLAELQAGLRKQTNEAHFATKVATLPSEDAGVAKLREAIDFEKVDTAGIDALVDPFVASLTAAGRVEMDTETIKVTQDAEDTRVALLASAVLGDTYKDKDGKEYNAQAIEKVIGEHFGDTGAQHSPQMLWDSLNQAYLMYGLTDAEVDADAEGRDVARLNITTGSTGVTPASSWGARLLQTIVTVARLLHDGSEMTGWMNTIIPAMHRVSVPDFQDRYYRYTGTFEQLKTVAENAAVPDIETSGAFRVPVKPVKKQGKFYLTYEAVMNSPTAAMRSLATAMGISISSTDYQEVLDKIFSLGGTNKPDSINGYETASGDAGATFLTLANGNLLTGNAAAPRPAGAAFSYDAAERAIDWMYRQSAYGVDTFALAGMIRAQTLVVPPQFWGSTDALTRATLKPGTDMNDVNRLQGMTVLPVSNSSFNATNLAKVFAVLARPADAQLFVMSTLAGQPPAFQPNVLRDDNANMNRITYKASHIRGIYPVDRRALVVSEG